MICNLGVVGSNPTRGSKTKNAEWTVFHTEFGKKTAGREIPVVKAKILGGFQSGQMGQTVNLLSFDFGGSNPSPPTLRIVFAEIAQLIEH